ncbi:MAG: VWA domain-containing protein [Marinicellaceae bacterium]
MQKIILLLLITLSQFVFAQKTLFDIEPNNKPENAQEFKGEFQVEGTLEQGDQDLFLWNLSDAATDYFWDIELTGVPGRLTQIDFMQLDFTQDGTSVTKVNKTLTLKHNDGLDTVSKKEMVFSPGQYYIGVSYAKDTSYKPGQNSMGSPFSAFGSVTSEEQELINVETEISEQNNYKILFKKKRKIKIYELKKAEKPVFVNKGNPLGFLVNEKDNWLKFNLSEDEANFTWKISGRASIGNHVKLILFDSNKKQIATTESNSEGFYSFDGLKLPAGESFIEFSSKTPNNLASLVFSKIGVYVEGSEIEPNNNLNIANKLNWDEPIKAMKNNSKDKDYFTFEIKEEQSGNAIGINLINPTKQSIELCLVNSYNKNLKCIKKSEDINFQNIALATGTYYLYLYRTKIETPYEILVSDKGKPKSGVEAEPNDKFLDAAKMSNKRMIKGTFDGNEFDFFKFQVTGKPQLWTIQAIGSNITGIKLYNGGKSAVQSMSYNKGNKRAKLTNLYLMPGTHVVSLRGTNGKYLLRAFPTGEPDLNFEMEPNDDKSRSIHLKFGDKKKGILSEAKDVDMYRFNLENDEYVQLKFKAPVGGSIRYILNWFGNKVADKSSQKGASMLFEGLLRAGDYYLTLMPTTSERSDDLYSVEMNRLPLYSCRQDCEPNDFFGSAHIIPLSSYIRGRNKTHGDEDWYQLPIFEEETALTFKNNLAQNNHYLRLYNKANNKSVDIKGVYEKEKLQTTFVIPAGVAPHIRLYGGENDYDYSLWIDQNQLSKEVNQLEGIEIELKNLEKSIAAYHDYAQKLKATVIIENKSNQSKSLKILSSISDFTWKVLNLPENIKLSANQKIELPFDVWVAKDTVGMRTVRLSLAVKDANHSIKETWHDMEVSGQINAINSQVDMSIPQELLGGINVAANYFGSKVPDEDINRFKGKGRGVLSLFNGYGMKGYGMVFRESFSKGNNFITVQLAGENPINVAGIVLNPTSDSNPKNYLKDFKFQLSDDGVNFETVLIDKIKAVDAEQSFVLPEQKAARFGRLYFLSNTYDLTQSVGLGEWKVITGPGQNILKVPDHGFNIADPKLGGYVPWAIPSFMANWNIDLLKPSKKAKRVRSSSDDDWQWVIGFHNQRAALINRIEWQKPELKPKQQTFDKVTLYVSMQSPSGPWEKIGSYELNDFYSKIQLEKETWARYVKFSVGNVPKKEYRYLPDQIKIYEKPISSDYLSILGEWGELSKHAIYERLNPPVKIAERDNENNHTKSTAKELKSGEQVYGQVQLEYADKPDWFKFTVPSGANTLKINLTGNQGIRTELHLEDQNGEEVPSIKTVSQFDQIIYQITVDSGESYFIKMTEPPRSVIFSWDTSGSTSAYHGTIFEALSQFAEGVIPDRDTINFMPFGNSLLMDQWYGQPYLLKTVLNNYDRKDGSSAAEKTLTKATEELSKRQGSKSIVLITDALTGASDKLWPQLNLVKPRIFSIGLINGSSNNTHDTQMDLMQSWSSVNNGEFDKITTNADLGIVFDKAASKLRQPAKYGLKVESEFVEAPGPGTLKIIEESEVSSTAVELILDASGSMLKRLNGKRRINIAKEVLVKAVTEIIPPKTPLALRVFGDKQANACRTDLAIKLSPLNPIIAKSKLENINAKNLAKTPIADSLAKVASDLKDHKGKKVVILVTDGEETCDGNPEEVIQQLINDGIDIRLNIVGFAIDDEELKQQFNDWSVQGGGKYFDSNNSESLKESISNALKTPYSVFSQSGELMKEGVVNGESIELPSGFYTIKVYGGTVKTYKNYQIKGEQSQQINLTDENN